MLVLILMSAALSGCAARQAFRAGEASARAGDWDAAVAYYQRAVKEDPDRPEYRIALERASLAASRWHLDRARELEEEHQLDQALLHYRRAAEYDPSNRQAVARAAEIERTIRDRIEAARPRPAIEQMRERARRTPVEPLLHPASREPLPRISFTNASLRDILSFMGNAAGINVTYDQTFQDRPYTIHLEEVTFEEALNQILTANQLFYKVLTERSIIIVPDTPQKRAQYEEQVIRTFFVSHADVQELAQLISSVIRVPQMAVQPMVAVNKTANTITIRATAAVASIIERIVDTNDKPRAEVVIDVEILEVNRSRAKQWGLSLTDYALGAIFSPELPPPNEPTVPTGVGSPPPFNLNTISQGVSTADFYAAVPAAFVRFLQTDSRTRLIAKPQLRGTEGSKLTLNLGDDIPVPSTTFAAFAPGGVATQPLTSFQYRAVGVNLELTPRVTFEGEILLELLVESSTLGAPIVVAGQALPSFGSRKVVTRLRLREGESNLLAGLLREDERRALRGLPGLMRLPILRQLASANEDEIAQTDIVMLLTPRIIRTHGLTQEDISPIHIGTQQNIGLTGPPPLIVAPGVPEAPAVDPGVPVLPAPDPAEPPVAAPPGVPLEPPAVPPPAAPPGVPVEPPAAPPGVPDTPPAAPPGVPGVPPDPAVPELPPEVPVPGAARVIITTPGTEFRVGGGPYTVPISIDGAAQLSVVTLTLTYNPAVLRVRAVQEGSFMRQGGVGVTFAQQVDPDTGRVDITLTRAADLIGASGSGLLAAVLFDAAAAGAATISASGVGATPTGAPVTLQFTPVAVTVR
jgi:general secretion pathway protein D